MNIQLVQDDEGFMILFGDDSLSAGIRMSNHLEILSMAKSLTEISQTLLDNISSDGEVTH